MKNIFLLIALLIPMCSFSADLSSINGVAVASISAINGVAKASVDSVNGLTVPSGGGGPTYEAVTNVVAAPNSNNNFDGRLGWKFTPSANITVTELGRWKKTGNSGNITVRLQTSTGTDIITAVVNVTAGSDNTFQYTAITPTALSSGTTYSIVSQETNGGNSWVDIAGINLDFETHIGSPVACYGAGTSGALTDVGGAEAYVPTNFKYTQP